MPVDGTDAACFRCPQCGGRLGSGATKTCRDCGQRFASERGILLLGASDAADEAYDPRHYDALAAVDRDHFWYRARRRAVVSALRRVVPDLETRALLDVGCGAGSMMAAFHAMGLEVAGGCDAHLDGLRLARGRTQRPLALVDAARIPPLASGQRLVGLFDVLEHVRDDRGFLEAIRESLAPGGCVVITVPAHPWLYDEADRIARHHRRYTRRSIVSLLRSVGLEPAWVSHFGAILVPLLLASRLAGWVVYRRSGAKEWRDRELSIIPGVNGLLDLALRCEWAVFGRCRLPLGTSVLAIATRPDSVG